MARACRGDHDRAIWRIDQAFWLGRLELRGKSKTPPSREEREKGGAPAFYFFEFFGESESRPKTPTPVVVPT
jgi:hypothetical protein